MMQTAVNILTTEARPCVLAEPAIRRPLLVLNLRGTQEEMGAQHGELMRKAGGFGQNLDFYPGLPEKLLSLSSTGRTVDEIVRSLGLPLLDALLVRLQRDRPAEFLRRTRTFMAALGASADEARFLMVMDLFQNVVGLLGRLGLGPFAKELSLRVPPACSTLSVWGECSADGQLRHARNFDLPGIGVWDKTPTVVFCDPDRGHRYGFIATRGADIPGVTAFNEAGISLTAHTRFHRDVSLGGAAVVDVGHEIVRSAQSIDDAIRIARSRQIASTWGIMVSSASEQRAIVLETTGRGVEVVEPDPGQDFLACSNRYRHPAMQAGELTMTPCWALHSDNREARLSQLAEQGRGRGGLQPSELEAALGDHVDPDAPGANRAAGAVVSQALTVQSVVIEPESRAVRVSVGDCPAGWGPYISVDWDWQAAVGAVESTADEAMGSQDARANVPLRGDRRRGFMHFVEATRIEGTTHDFEGALVELEAAIAADDTSPSYRFLAGTIHLRYGRAAAALEHFEAGLLKETAIFRRAQFLLWGARAADQLVEHRVRAESMRQTLLALEHPLIGEYHAAARRELVAPRPGAFTGKVRPNFMIIDAF